ncbi:MAG: hypothetical protein IPK82_25460 [Polyangiaceae bacterium]|nr:hypothetical protein [Polyangiaceae bacterium]
MRALPSPRLVSLAAMSLVLATSASAFAAAKYVMLKSGSGDGYAAFNVDEVGFTLGCGGPAASMEGIQFDPVGAAPQQNVNCNTQLYVLDPVGKRRQSLIHGQWNYFLECGGDPAKEFEIDSTSILSDVTVGTYKRITVFTLPNIPSITVSLTQRAQGAELIQAYTFKNDTLKDITLRLVRVADLDVEYTGNFTTNLGGPYGINGAYVTDQGGTAQMAITAEGGKFDGWRIFQNTGGAAAAHSTTWVNFGYTANQLNGYFPGGAQRLPRVLRHVRRSRSHA